MITKMRTCVYNFNFHLVFVTKYRQAIFTTDDKRNAMKQMLIGLANKNGIALQGIEVMADHVHLMISFPPKVTPSSVVKSFKGGSAKAWFMQYPETKSWLWKGHLWSPSYFMSTLGDVSKDIVEKYIQNQRQKRVTR